MKIMIVYNLVFLFYYTHAWIRQIKRKRKRKDKIIMLIKIWDDSCALMLELGSSCWWTCLAFVISNDYFLPLCNFSSCSSTLDFDCICSDIFCPMLGPSSNLFQHHIRNHSELKLCLFLYHMFNRLCSYIGLKISGLLQKIQLANFLI